MRALYTEPLALSIPYVSHNLMISDRFSSIVTVVDLGRQNIEAATILVRQTPHSMPDYVSSLIQELFVWDISTIFTSDGKL